MRLEFEKIENELSCVLSSYPEQKDYATVAPLRENLWAEIALVCRECKAFCLTNQFLAAKIANIEEYIPRGNIVEKNDAAL